MKTRILMLALASLLAVVLGAPLATADPQLPVQDDERPEGVQELLDRQREDIEEELGKPATRQEAEGRMGAVPCEDGMAGPYPCKDVDLASLIPLSEFGAESGNDIWGWTDPETGKEYALMGLNNGTGFVDVSKPSNPVYLGKLPTATEPSLWRDIKVYKNHAYIVSEAEGHGMQVFDLTRLRGTSEEREWTADDVYDGFGNAHNVAINEETGFAYAVGSNTCEGGLHMINIRIPDAPVFAGCYEDAGYTHDTEVVVYDGPDEEYQGREIAFSSNGNLPGTNTVEITDVTNKANPEQINSITYTGAGYAHQGWLTEDQRYFLFGDELDETALQHNTRTRIFDLEDLDMNASNLTPAIYDGPTKAIDHNMYLKDGLVHQANYTAGYRLLDGAGIPDGTLEEIAFFDVFPEDDDATFNGAWSNYPYFDSGTVIVSGIEQGLFVLRPEATRPDDPDPDPAPTNPGACTITGTGGNDKLRGTPGDDVICGLGGNDQISGLGGNDILRGGPGNDSISGGDGNDRIIDGPGRDRLTGNNGRDRLDARDGVRGNDVVDGGPGRDSCVADQRDVRRNCP